MLTVRSTVDGPKWALVGGQEWLTPSPVDQGEPGVSLTQRLTLAHAAQGGITLGPEQGELEANFCCLGGPVEETSVVFGFYQFWM
jgi:hypothetical protein